VRLVGQQHQGLLLLHTLQLPLAVLLPAKLLMRLLCCCC
jgi:hypothetical protein